MLRVVSPTQYSEQGFRQYSRLALSLAKLQSTGEMQAHITCRNALGVPAVYNAVIAGADENDVALFTHDDVSLDDWFLQTRLAEALARFDVVGVAGNRRRLPKQCGWAFRERPGEWDQGFLSGAVSHPQDRVELVSVYGPTPAEVKFIDGVFIAVRIGTLRGAGVRFDPLFVHHFYDLDFCRSCEQAGLRLGTWPIAITHASGGNFGGPEWQQAFAVYLDKWKE